MEDEKIFWYTEDIDFLSILKENQADTNNCQTYARGEFIFFPEDDADTVFYIAKGRVKIGSFGKEGKEVLNTIVYPKEIFGLAAIFGEKSRKKFAQALEYTTIYSILKTEVMHLVSQKIEITSFFLKTMGFRVFELEKRLESLAFKDSRTRIIGFILDLADARGLRIGYETLIKHFFTHQEVANLTSTSRQTVTMILNDLRQQNILTFNRKRLLIRDLDLLRSEIQSVT